jgi:DNA (cytosine-5)-methyltransferase 1
MRVLSICSGIEACTVAWQPLGWSFAAYAEIDKFASAVLAHRHPQVPNLGDFTKIQPADIDGPIDVLVGGTPCQSFSIAGLRGGLDDDRGNLALEFLRLAQRIQPRWLLWENVPGVLSSSRGRDFGSIITAMAELGYGVAYRVLDAQYWGLAQRRKRVFVVGYSGDWRRAVAVLFERESLSRDTAPRRKAREDLAPTIVARSTGGGGLGTNFDLDGGLIARPLLAGGHANNPLDENAIAGVYDKSHANGGVQVAVAQAIGVRRLTPRECERLQGFPDDYTRIPVRTYKNPPRGKHRQKYPELYEVNADGSCTRFAADRPRYRVLGNSMPVPIMRWIGERIQQVDTIQEGKLAA